MEVLLKGSLELNKMFSAIQKTADWIRRDFGEIENLQQSLPSANDFVRKASEKIEESICCDLLLVRPSAGLLTPNISESGDGRDEFVLSLSGSSNFVRSNDNFAISLALRSMDETKIALVYSPIKDKLYYCEKGAGAFVFSSRHSTKIHTSNIKLFEECTIAYNIFEKINITRNFRFSGCPALDLAHVACGKIDIFISEQIDYSEIAAGELLIQESGGKVIFSDKIIAYNGITNINI